MKLLLICTLIVAVAAVAADVNELPSNEYLPPAASVPVSVYSAPAVGSGLQASVPVASSSALAPILSLPAAPASVTYGAVAATPVAVEPAIENYQTSASEPAPAHTFSASEGYRYKTHRRRIVRRRFRRGLPSNEYLPPIQSAASAPSVEYLPPAASAPVAVNQSPITDYESGASEPLPAHSFSPVDGYRYKTQKRRRVLRLHRF